MSEPAAESNDLVTQWRCFSFALVALAIYFGLALVPKWWPGFAGTGFFFLYILSTPVVLAVLLGILIWGGIGAIRSRHRGSSDSRRYQAQLVLPLAGFLMAGATIALARSIRGELPSGSHSQQFDSAIWQDPTSLEWSRGEDTPRQRMLGSTVQRLTPTLDRSQIEAMLGPSRDTEYFESTGRDLIYLLGPERDAFFRWDEEWLLIWLDDSNHFERYEIYTD